VIVEVWAPKAKKVAVRISEPGQMETGIGWTVPLNPQPDGWYGRDVDEARPGRDYGFLLDDDETLLTDPRSRRQPFGVHGPSRFYDPTFDWTDGTWQGKPLPRSVVYEMHIGTFTSEGTFAAAIERLDDLVELGITHVELLPVNDFNGKWNWGYDGVLWYAVHEAYGGPDGLKRFVDACHARGLAATLDVVYNHLGPSGNALPRFGPYLKAGRSTWGDLINLDGASSGPVRAFILQNAEMWFAEFHFDALRLDAVHALHDDSPRHILSELSERIEHLAGILGRPLLLIAESDLNDPVMITPRGEGGYGLEAQWDDDVHHALHALLTGERQAYYVDFGSLAVLAKVFTRAFLHDGTYSTFRGRVHGKPIDRRAVQGYQFVACLQDHDQVGNRALGDRLSELTTPALLKVGAVLLFTSPFTPMLWMGEEWAASTRWPFFTSHPEPALAEATGEGRLAEFGDHGWNTAEMIDPQDPKAFFGAKLRWEEREEPGHREMLAFYQELLALRRNHPDLTDGRLDTIDVAFDEDQRWITVQRGALVVAANVGETDRVVATYGQEILLATDEAVAVAEGGVHLPAQSAAVLRQRDG
jgi:maltooligosyltrehalose trehalohydrolase